MVAGWVRCVAEAGARASAKSRECEKEKDGEENLGLRLLRGAFGGEDLMIMSISQVITLDMERPWMDDTTIIVPLPAWLRPRLFAVNGLTKPLLATCSMTSLFAFTLTPLVFLPGFAAYIHPYWTHQTHCGNAW
jgi:hypothetical protein